MTRLMGDAIHVNVPQLAAIRGQLQLVAGYDSGTPDIDWTPSDWAQFPGLPQVHIDQAFNSTINTEAHVVVFDVEPGAYQPSQAGQLITINQTPRPTVYVNQSNIVATVQSARTAPNWRGDTWVAIPGWQPGDPWSTEVQQAISIGAVIVAVQNQLDVANAYDLSAVLDPVWPAISVRSVDMVILEVDRATVPAGVNWPGDWLLTGLGTIQHIETVAKLTAYQNAGIGMKTVSYADWQALAGVQ